MKIYVILIALLPLAAIGVDMYLNESNVSFLRDVASGELAEEDAATAAADTEVPEAAAVVVAEATETTGDTNGESPAPAPATEDTVSELPAPDSVTPESLSAESPSQASPPTEQASADPTAPTGETPPDNAATASPAEAASDGNTAPVAEANAGTGADVTSDVASDAAQDQVAALPAPTETPAAAEEAVDTNMVWLVQDRLNRLGYVGSEPLIPDGRLNANTKLAIRAYQIHQGLPSDGRPSAALLEHLESALEQSLSSTSPSFVEQSAAATTTAAESNEAVPATGEPDVGTPLVSDAGPTASEPAAAPAPQASQSAALPPAEAAGTPQDVSDPVADSADSSLVFLIQDRLNRLGYSGNRPLTPDGRLGPRTRAIITSYQEDKGLPPTGAPTEALLNHMEATLTGRKPQSALPAIAEGAAEPATASDDAAPAAAAETANAETAPAMAVTGLSVAPQSAPPAEASGTPGVSGYVSFRKGLAATREGAHTAAIEHYSQAIDSQDWLEKHLAFSRRGDAHSNQGNLDAALADYSAAIRLKPDYTDAMLRRAMVYEAKEMPDHAISDYRRVTEIDPSEGRAAERLKQLGITTQ